MIKLKTLFRLKEHIAAYEGLVLTWRCVDEISSHLASLIPDESLPQILPVVQKAIAAYNQPYPFYMTDWERLAVYIITIINFVTKTLDGKMSFHQVVNSCPLPRRITSAFIEDTAKKISLELEYA